MSDDFDFDQHLADHLKMWKDSGIEAPKNELQSIAAWLRYLGMEGEEKTKETMRTRMVLLMNAVNKIAEQGSKAEVAAGIYDNDLEALRKRAFNEGVEAAAKRIDEHFEGSMHENSGDVVRKLKVDYDG